MDVEAEHRALRMAHAKVGVAGLWPFLALAQSEQEFDNRLALATDHIANAVPVDLLEPVISSLWDDFRAVTAAKDAEGEEDASDEDDDSGGMPGWLDKKIKGEGAYYHQGRREWVAAVAPEPKIQTQASYWHAGRQEWIKVANEEIQDHPGGGNPYYFTGGPEAGPLTGDTSQFPPAPTGPDPVDPLNQMFPMQPSPWTVPPDKGWVENPMNFNPPGSMHSAAQSPYESTCRTCGKAIFAPGGAGGSADWRHHEYVPRTDHTASPVAEHYDMVNRLHNGSQRTAEGVEGGPGPNPNFFGGGGEGVSGDQGGGFPQDLATEDPDDRVNELYGASPITGGDVDYGNHVAHRRTAAQPDNPPPDSDKLMGTEFDSPEERDRWNRAQAGEQQGSRDSTPFAGVRHTAPGGGAHPPYKVEKGDGGYYVVNGKGERKSDDPMSEAQAHAQQRALYANASRQSHAFFDPSDPTVHMAQGNPFGDGNPFGGGAGGAAPGVDPAEKARQQKLHPESPGPAPATTRPRQIPGGGSTPNGSASDDASKKAPPTGMGATGVRRQADGENRFRPTNDNPYGTDDPFDARTWENATKQRPRLELDQMGFNGPQNPGAREPIRTTHSPGQGAEEDDEDERRVAARRVSEEIVRELVGAR